jgi:PAS domain S-box-containing protein
MKQIFQKNQNQNQNQNQDKDQKQYKKEQNQNKSTYQKQQEDQSQEEKKFEKLVRRFNLATRSAKIGIWEWDIINNILIWDDQMYALYGIQKEDFTGAYEAWHKGLHPDDKKRGNEEIQSALRGEKEFNTTFRVIWPNGEIHYIRAHGDVERDEQGKPLLMRGVDWDITKEKEIDIQKTEFVSLASHQLKTPIGALNWDLEKFLNGDYGDITQKQRTVLAEMYMLSHRVNELVNGLLNTSRLDMGIFVIEPVPTNVVLLCEEVLKEMKSQCIAKGHTLHTEYSSDIGLVSVDQKLFRILLQNLLSNAIKYTAHNGVITIKIYIQNDELIVSVANNGDPIIEKDQPKIFEKMYRGDNAHMQSSDGNGLGLYIVKKIIDHSGGHLWFTSALGEDTVFTITFPRTGMKKNDGLAS